MAEPDHSKDSIQKIHDELREFLNNKFSRALGGIANSFGRAFKALAQEHQKMRSGSNAQSNEPEEEKEKRDKRKPR